MTAVKAEHRPSAGGLAPADSSKPSTLVVQREAGTPHLDLGRELHCLFGLSFDAITLDEAARRLRRSASGQQRCFISTPNVNFVVAAQNDDAFRKSVLHSDLSLADGMPIVWAARLMGAPIRERVAGSDLFELLCRPHAAPLKVYFFGGPDGVAERAARALNAQQGGLRCVGFASPGFGSIAEISSPDMIDRINASGADFVVVALGAKKGQAWIEHNRYRLEAPLISHLGAVVNFVAGSVNRAPVLWQRFGMEWLWRVKEEPALWRRYVNDGWALGRLVLSRVLPCALAMASHRLFGRLHAPPRHETTSKGSLAVVRLSGAWTREALPSLRREMASWLARDAATLQFDLSEVTWVDSALLGLLLVFDEWQGEARAVLPGSTPKRAVRRLFRWHGAESLLNP
jgi:N-acetylglucosaminyldiphosphoundecaprenol N-acetyl-beta-D-mannosaminyltransferase